MAGRPLLSVIVPTYNEIGNIQALLGRLDRALDQHRYEVLIVDDDSEDGTWQLAEQVARFDPRVTLIRRTTERGLSSAIVAGMRAAQGQVLVAIDADLQHDEQKIPELFLSVIEGGVDICIGTRAADDGDYGSFAKRRRVVSWTGSAMARLVLDVQLSDPMTGFFAVSRSRFDLVVDELNPLGFKVLLELVALGPRPTVAEVGYHFRQRSSGETKLNGSVMLQFLTALLGLAISRFTRWSGRSASAARR